MATRSNIAIVLKKEDIGKEMKFDVNKLPSGFTYDDECIDSVGSVTPTKPVLQIYHHWDGYPEGVGLGLLDGFNDYDSLLNLILGGDTSSILSNTIVQYCASRGEEWEDVKPQELDEPQLQEEYVYKFENGKWYVKDCYGHKEWTLLEEVLKERV